MVGKILAFIKSNVVMVVCGLIVIGAIIALMIPIRAQYADLQARADARRGDYTLMNGILNKQRTMPVMSLHDTTAKPLPQFPTEAIIEAAKKQSESLKGESDSVLQSAIKLNEHKPLSPGALPDGRPSQLIDFRREYVRTIDYTSDEGRPNSFPSLIMNAGQPPTPGQIGAEKKRTEDEIRKLTAFNPQTGQPINGKEIDQQVQRSVPGVADQMKREAAEKCAVYVDPTTFEPYATLTGLQPGVTPEPADVFIAQVTLWVQQDVAQAIAAANAGSKNVMEAPVKHLVKVLVPASLFSATGAPPDPASASIDPAGPIPKNFSVSPTGRATNGVYDVIPLSIRINVDAEQVPRVLREFSRNRFLTVTNCSVSSVDLALLEAQGYFYGVKPVVQLDLQCEDLFLRTWTTPLMPARIKAAVGLGPAGAAATPVNGSNN